MVPQQNPQLPGELPKTLSMRCKPSSLDPFRSPCNVGVESSSCCGHSTDECCSKNCTKAAHLESAGSNGDFDNGIPKSEQLSPKAGEDPLKVLRRLDDIIDRLMKSCNVEPEVCLHTPNNSKDPVTVRVLEERLEEIIKRLSERGHFERVHKGDLCLTPTRTPGNSEPAGICTTPKSLSCKSGTAPNTVRSLFSKSNSAEKVDPLASPRPSSRSGRFVAALSFLASPRRAGISSLRIGSPISHKTQDGFMDR